MRPRLALVIGLALAGSAPHGAAAPDSAEAREAAIRAYIEELAGPTRFPTLPIKIELTFEMASQRSPEKTNEIMARYANLPDHPERVEWERHATLQARPHNEPATFLIASSATWFIQTGIAEGATLFIGEHDGQRWMWFDAGPSASTITLTAAGVPYPTSANIWQIKNEYIRRLRMVVNASIPESSFRIDYMNASADQWDADIHSGNQDGRIHLSGDWIDHQPRVQEVVRSRLRPSGDISEDFDSISIRYEVGVSVPTVAIRLRDDHISEQLRLTSFVSAENQAVASAAKVPEPLPDDIEVVDFRTNSIDLADETIPMLVFKPGKSPVRLGEASDASVDGRPRAEQSQDQKIPAGSGNTDEQEGSFVRNSVVVGGLMLAGLLVAVFVWRRHKP